MNEGAYDLVLLDVAPRQLTGHLAEGLRLARPGGTVVIAHALSKGRVADPVRRDEATVELRGILTQAFESEETKYLLARAINTLPEREKIVVTLYYYEGLTLAEIGSVLGVTESRICQMHTKAVLQMRSKLTEQHDDD